MTASRPIPEADLPNVTLAIVGMTCGSCARHVQKALAELDGVQEADIDRGRAQAVVTYDPTLVGPAAMAQAIEDAGYAATPLPA